MKKSLKVAMVQMSAVLLDRNGTLDKMITYAERAAKDGAELCIFGESMIPGYPFWIENTEGAKFNNQIQKEIHAVYIDQAIDPFSDLTSLQNLAKAYKMAIVTGSMERAQDRGGHSIYCSLVYIDQNGIVKNVHRKLMPTYEERLSWAAGDGHGLKTFPIGPFTMGGLNCWENWMPMARTSLYAQGENLHIAIWPGCVRNTEILTRFLAREGRSYVISVCGLMTKADIPQDFPHRDLFISNASDVLADGGSCVALPNGDWLQAPIAEKEGVFIVELDFNKVLEERQNFDPVGHYSRPDVFDLSVNRKRQTGFTFED